MFQSVRSVLDVFRQPVLPEVRENLRRSWESLPPEFRTPQQMFGRQGNPCGATIGTMPRCDFACRGCYLGEEANHVPAEGVEAIKAQMRALRPLLGHNGNLQMTDGEVTLRDEAELIELLRYADEIDLIPMVMTHGDSFRRRPGLLERLMVEGGLREISVHVDTTMRGRKGPEYKNAGTEAELNPLREEFAQIIRDARRKTGRPLVAATTMTVTRDNLAGVKDAVRCVSHNADAFKMISFQPAAKVGRTEEGVEGVEVDELWAEVAKGLSGDGADPAYLWKGRMQLGHHACNRYVHGWMVHDGDGPGRYVSLRQEGDPIDERTVDGYMARFGGASFRRDTPARARARLLGILAHAPGFWLGTGVPYFWHQVKKMDPQRPARLAGRLATGRARAVHFNIVSHHFMSRDQIETPEGKARMDLCVFRVPIGDRLVSMCEVNALGVRDAYYEDIRAGRPPGRQLRVLGRASQAPPPAP
jgi:hypothetical protein